MSQKFTIFVTNDINMKTEITIPESTITDSIVEFRIRLSDNKVIAVVQETTNQNTYIKKINVPINTIWEQATDVQKNIIRAFFKQIAVLAFQDHSEAKTITAETIMGDVFDTIETATKTTTES